MFLISVLYVQPLDEVDASLPDHVDFLKRYYAQGVFLLSGRKVPRTGGIILARNVTRAELDEIICEDPFHQKGLAMYEVTEFTPSMAAQDIATFVEA